MAIATENVSLPTLDNYEAPRHIWLTDPLNEHLTTMDSYNERIKMYGVDGEAVETPEAQKVLDRHFYDNDSYSKLAIFAPENASGFEGSDFHREGRIKNFFRDGTDAEIWAQYTDDGRYRDEMLPVEEKVLAIADSKPVEMERVLPEGYSFRTAVESDAEGISQAMQGVFEDYPVEITPEAILPRIVRQESAYVLIEKDDEIAALASAEIDQGWQNAEITDCVTVEGHRRQGLMAAVIDKVIEHTTETYNILDYYSLARATQPGINVALKRNGFSYDGYLLNHCRMPGGWESLNIWCRSERDK